MEIMLALLPVYLLAFLVAILKAKKILSNDSSVYLTPILFKIVAPALIFSILAQTTIDFGTLALLGYAVIFFVFFVIIFSFFKKFAGNDSKTQRAALVGGVSFAIGTVAYPIIQSAFASEVFAQVVVIDLTLVILFMLAAPIFAVGRVDAKSVGKLLLTDPILWSVYLGIGVSLFGIQLPSEVMKIFTFAGSGFSFLSAVILGFVVTIPTREQLKNVASMTIIKIAIWIILSIVLMQLPLPLITKQAIIMSISAPVGLFPVMYAEQYKLDKEFTAQWAIVNTFFMVLLYPFVVAVIQ